MAGRDKSMKASKDTIPQDQQKYGIQVEPDSDSTREPENGPSETIAAHSAPIRIASSSMGACASSNNKSKDSNIALLQQSYGNHATLRLLNQQSAAVQPKLKISQPQDPYEQEADKLADLATNGSGTERQMRPG